MRPRWAILSHQDRETFRAVSAFLNGRLEEREIVDWALHLRPSEDIKRIAVLDLIDSPYGRKLSEPWRSAWHLIEESWDDFAIDSEASSDAYHARDRLRSGDRSGALWARGDDAPPLRRDSRDLQAPPGGRQPAHGRLRPRHRQGRQGLLPARDLPLEAPRSPERRPIRRRGSTHV